MRRKAFVFAILLGLSILAPQFVLAAADTVGVYRPSDAAFYLREANSSGWADMMCFFGAGADQPVTGDWDGNGFSSVGIFRDGMFHLRNSTDTGLPDLCFPYGIAGDIPIMGDWNGDGVKTIGVYRNNFFYLRNSNDSGPADLTFAFGEPGDLPVAGDWNNDGTETVGVYRNGLFFLKNANSPGDADLVFFYGIPGDQPLAGDWDGNGTVTVGVYRPADGLFHLRNSNDMGFGDMVFAYGTTNDLPVTGVWDKQPVADPMIVSFNAEPQTIAPGDSATLTWSISNATSADIDQGIGTVNAVGGSTQVSPNVTTTYTLSATNAAKTVTAQAIVTVTTAAAPTISSFTAQPGAIDPGASATLSWSIQNADSASIDQGVGSVDPASGSIEVSPTISTTYTLSAVNANGTTTSQATVEVTTGLPPDPSAVAPDLDNTVATTLIPAVEFLYSGDDPIQTGILPDTINPLQVAVLRGKVMTRDGDPLPGATLSILDHPEYGQTRSRADGMFDMAVNGGGILTVKYHKAGYLPAQRTVDIPWQNFVSLTEVILIPLDPHVTAVDLDSTEPQWVQGGEVTDEDGSREPALLIMPNRSAVLEFPDGGTQPVNSLNVRITEYSVGPNGPQSMPAQLPPTSAYTFCFEVSADEALAAGASQVTFDQPVFFYVENFLGFPTGTPIPLGYYDRAQAAWLPEQDGLVLRIINIDNNLAELDIDGDDLADDPAALQALGIADVEREMLAARYEAGATLWRLAINHFSSYDPNYGVVPEDGAEEPKLPTPGGGSGNKPDFDCFSFGSYIECSNQVLSEQMSIVGTPYALHYASDRMPDHKANFTLDIPLSGDAPPTALKRIDLSIQVAGQTHRFSYAPAANLSHLFQWNGKDVYGRAVHGLQPVKVQIDYVYDGWYALPPAMAESFGFPSGKPAPGNIPAREGAVLAQIHHKTLGISPSQEDLGGWSLDAQHHYDPLGGVLYLGTGSRRSARNVNMRVLHRVAGTDEIGFSGDGGPALEAKLWGPHDVAMTADGGFYIADFANQRVRYVTAEGIISTVAGNGVAGNSGDGGPALEAQLLRPTDLALGPDGSLYMAFHYDDNVPAEADHRIRRVKDGIITTVAGNGDMGFGGDGGPATEAQLKGPSAVAVAADGTLYIADQGNHCIRRVAPDGVISTFAGTPEVSDYSGDGGPATEAKMAAPSDLTIGPDGSLYVFELENNLVRKISPFGIISTVIDLGAAGYVSVEGTNRVAAAEQNSGWLQGLVNAVENFWQVPSAHAIIFLRLPKDLAVAPDGTLFIATPMAILQLNTAGNLEVIAGKGTDPTPPEGSPATQVRFTEIKGLAVAPDGSIYFCNTDSPYASSVARLSSVMPGFSANDIVIPSSSGEQLYQFNPAGKHLQTIHSLTGGVLQQFAYDAAGRLLEVRDGDSNTTIIERDGSGKPTAIVSPYGQRTTLGLDGNGYLSSITNPASETTQFSYSSGGLLQQQIDPKTSATNYQYDDWGRITQEDNPAGGFQSLIRTTFARGHQVTRKTKLDRSNKFQVEWLESGSQLRTNTLADGTQTTRETTPDGTDTTHTANGMETTSRQAPDPRFGMQAPLAAQRTVSTPGGLTQSEVSERTVVLTDPADPLSLTSLTETFAKNSRVFTQVYSAATRTFTETSPEGRQTIRVIDASGRLVRYQAGNLNPTLYSYDDRGRTTDIAWGEGAEARTTLYSYDSNGRLRTMTDPLGGVTELQHDPAGRRTSLALPGGLVVGYGYDANGNLTAITPPGKPTHQFAYTATNLLQQYLPPVVAGSGATATAYDYDLDQLLLRTTRPDSLTIELEYDSAGRLARQLLPAGELLHTYSAGTGQLESITSPSGIVLTFTYDGNLVTGTTWQGVVTGSVSRVYDNDFHLTQLLVNGGNQVTYKYDKDGMLVQAGAITLTRSQQNGLITGAALGNVVDARVYNAFGELVDYQVKLNETELFSVQYSYDKLGRITEKIEAGGGAPDTFSYRYDAAGRLAEVGKNAAVAASYSYDANGNRLSYSGAAGPIAGSYDDQDRLLQYGDTTYTYTANGELQSRTRGAQATTYQVDAIGNLVQAVLPDGRQIDYLIDGKSRRVGKKVNDSLVQGFLYLDHVNPVAELDENNQPVAVFVYGSREMTPDYMIKGGVTYRIVADQLGSVRLVVNAESGEVVQRIDYDEFGRILQDTNPEFQPFRFAGGLYDHDTGLVRFGARDYDPDTGRWTARDPSLFAGSQTNFYVYVNNNPVSRIDPTGMDWKDWIDREAWDKWWAKQWEEAWNWNKMTTFNEQEKKPAQNFNEGFTDVAEGQEISVGELNRQLNANANTPYAHEFQKDFNESLAKNEYLVKYVDDWDSLYYERTIIEKWMRDWAKQKGYNPDEVLNSLKFCW